MAIKGYTIVFHHACATGLLRAKTLLFVLGSKSKELLENMAREEFHGARVSPVGQTFTHEYEKMTSE